jgi:hypothetical protein
VGTTYYVWCDDDCANKTQDLEEARRWAAGFIREGRDAWIVDADDALIPVEG